MPNSDNTFGTFNKKTQILSQIDDGSTALTNHANVAAGKSFFYTAEALTVFDECCTELQWALVADDNGDNTKLKCTMTFGTKGTAGIAAADDWAGQFNSRKTALLDADGWSNAGYTTADSSDHLF
tara:strand:+ start:91 stop:465 length:375 start_codon:yes stop_codon:yes gene_type:complete